MTHYDISDGNTSEYQEILKHARSLLSCVQNTPNTDILETTQSLLSAKLLKLICNSKNPDPKKMEQWINMLNRLTNSQIKIAKMRLSFSHSIREAKENIIHELAVSLKNHPRVLHEISDIVRQIKISL